MLAGTTGEARSDLQRPSMAQDMAKGRRTEIEFMNGFIAAKARGSRRAGAHARTPDRGREAGGTRDLASRSVECPVELTTAAATRDSFAPADRSRRTVTD